MDKPQKNPDQLLQRLESLMEKQLQLQQEMLQLKNEILSQKAGEPGNVISDVPDTASPEGMDIKETLIREETSLSYEKETEDTFESLSVDYYTESHEVSYTGPKPEGGLVKPESAPPNAANLATGKSNLEKFIGENLINKIGIAITVIGVGIGAKYSIENDLISPLTRIILGYLFGLGLIGFAIWLKAKYENFSAVLLSGGMATLYLITFAAYSFYGLFPQVFAFIMMVLFTAFTVVAAINYNKQVIAHIGLVGAYAVPFLLSDGSGKVGVLFTYMAIINSGILMIAIKRYWKPLHYSAFFFTWIIFMSWYFNRYIEQSHFGLSLAFLSVFFIIFYASFLSYKVVRKEQFVTGDVVLLLLNSFIFYGLGYAILSGHLIGEQFLGLFTLLNAIVHFGVSAMIYRKKLADKNLFYLLAGLVLVFITIAVPVQLDGNWVTLLWAGQAVLLFWIGRRNQVPLYEALSYPLIILSFISILQDWSSHNSYSYTNAYPVEQLRVIFNFQFLSALLFIIAFALLQYFNTKNRYTSQLKIRETLQPVFSYIIPVILLVVSYFAFRIEVERYWDQRFVASAVENIVDNEYSYNTNYYDYSLTSLKNIWIINYSLLFLIGLTWANILKIKNNVLDKAIYGLNIFATIAFLSLSLYLFGELRDYYLNQYLAEYYHRDSAHLPARYISLVIFAGFMYSFYRMIQQFSHNAGLKASFDYILHISLLWIASSEMINWLELMGSSQSYKLGLSILWGLYALALIVLGIWKKKKHLRMAAIGLFGVTLVKLFFYDIIHLDTIAKTIVFVSLGILLLIISFLYNKYKLKISNEV